MGLFTRFRSEFEKREPFGGWSRIVGAGCLIAPAIRVLCLVVDSALAERDTKIQKLEEELERLRVDLRKLDWDLRG